MGVVYFARSDWSFEDKPAENTKCGVSLSHLSLSPSLSTTTTSTTNTTDSYMR